MGDVLRLVKKDWKSTQLIRNPVSRELLYGYTFLQLIPWIVCDQLSHKDDLTEQLQNSSSSKKIRHTYPQKDPWRGAAQLEAQ